MRLIWLTSTLMLVFLCLPADATGLKDICGFSPDSGHCKGSIPRWYFNNNTGQCAPFIYGGCDGNANNFITKEDCGKSCSLTDCQLMQLLLGSVPGDFFVPQCKPDGRFEDMQCWNEKGYCFCVNKNGTEITGTRKYGPNKPNCQNLSSCENYKCTAPYSTCNVVSGKPKCQCSFACPFIFMPVCGTDGKTYANDCVMKAEACKQKQMITVSEHGECEGPCIKAMKKALGPIILVQGKPVPISATPYIPTCDQDGFFAPKQCNKTSGECWCVDRVGNELLNSRKKAGQSLQCDDKCKNMTCSKPYARCHVIKGEALCYCPMAATKIYSPVCGTDGQTYSNEDVMMAKACEQNKMIAVAKDGKCDDDICKDVLCPLPYAKCHVINNEPLCKCQQFCTMEYDPVCGNDGQTYGNLCEMTSNACEQNRTIVVASKGECEQQCKNFDCSSQPYSQCVLVNGKPKCQCQTFCTREYFPVCGSDGKTYTNICIMKATSCLANKMITASRFGQCDVDLCEGMQCPSPYGKCKVIKKKPICHCQQFCSYDHAPVCGNDGKTYANLCMMTSHACEVNQTITVAKQGKCEEDKCSNFDCSSRPYQQCRVVDGKPQCQCQHACSRIYMPVCGSDGKSYGNLCMLKANACKNNTMIVVAKNGNCVEAIPNKLPDIGKRQQHSGVMQDSTSGSKGTIIGLSLFSVVCVLAVVGVVMWSLKRRSPAMYSTFDNESDTAQLRMHKST